MRSATMDGAIARLFVRLFDEMKARMTDGVSLRGANHMAVVRAEARAEMAEERLKEALNVLPEGIVFLDSDGRYIMWNDAYAEIYEKSADLFQRGVRLVDTLKIGIRRGDYPEAIGREDEWLEERMALLNNPEVRHEQRLANGRVILIEERKTKDGGTIGIRVDITDMKEQAARLEKALDEANAANKAKSEFLANMSHEIRTPLNGVIGLADVLSRTRLDEKQRDLLGTLMASAGDLNNLLGDLLDYSKAGAGKLTLNEDVIELASLVEATAAGYQPQARDKGIDFIVKIHDDARGPVCADGSRLRQVMGNLLSNAVKFTSEGSIEVGLRRSGSGAYVFEVRDTGVGFDPAAADRLFARFEQADGSVTRKFGGTGLGLSICRQLCDLMGGTISAAGEVGKGAVFTVILPLQAAEAVRPEVELVEAEDYPPLKVLLVDDNATNRKVVQLMLVQVGAEVTACEDGQEAVSAFKKGAYDLILMDLQMPVMDGLSATRAIREIERINDAARTALVVLSANNSPDDRRATAEAGADAHIGKPIRAEELFSTIGRVLEGEEGVAAEEAAA